jgi:hypothetical protein
MLIEKSRPYFSTEYINRLKTAIHDAVTGDSAIKFVDLAVGSFQDLPDEAFHKLASFDARTIRTFIGKFGSFSILKNMFDRLTAQTSKRLELGTLLKHLRANHGIQEPETRFLLEFHPDLEIIFHQLAEHVTLRKDT